MVDNRELQHRPRTSRELRKRLITAAEAAGADSPTFHDALKVATAYLEIGVGGPTCPNCGASLSSKRTGTNGDTRFECYNCTWTPNFSRVLDIEEPDVPVP